MSTLISISLFAMLLAIASAAPPQDSIRFSSKITPELQAAFKTKSVTNVFVYFQEDTSKIIEQIQSNRFSSREERLNTLYSSLVSHAQNSQRRLMAFLETQDGVQFESLWINNQLYVRGVDAETANLLALFDEVKSIDEEIFAHLIEPTENANVSKTTEEFEWGIVKIQAPEAWEEIGNNDGKGVVVATIDTGVRLTHEALRDNFFGDYGWFDPSTSEPLPTDRNGHGTHTTGTIAGRNGIGVAPGATWMACRGCATSSCSQFDLSRCGQFFACPSLADGTNYDCSKAPNVVSNSWGGGRGATWFIPVINAWVAAGIVPVFSIGNSGPSCNTANSPGDIKDVIGVGSTMISDSISSFSSVGPTLDGRMKPDISAPGSEVISAYYLADDSYRALSGTSMAAPHVSGTVALLLSRDKDLSIEDIKQLLFQNTDKELQFSGRVCEGVGDGVFPNHVFGSGRVNAFKSVVAQTKLLKQRN